MHIAVRVLCALASLGASLWPALAIAQQVVAPPQIAITPADLPPGFVESEPPKYTRLATNQQGAQFIVGLFREVTARNLGSGPILVRQVIVRSDGVVDPSEYLDALRQGLIQESGFSPVPGAPNDAFTASLVKYEGEFVSFEVGIVKNDTVIFSRASGLSSVVTLDNAFGLAAISSAKYDAAYARLPSPAAPGQVVRTQSPPPPDTLPPWTRRGLEPVRIVLTGRPPACLVSSAADGDLSVTVLGVREAVGTVEVAIRFDNVSDKPRYYNLVNFELALASGALVNSLVGQAGQVPARGVAPARLVFPLPPGAEAAELVWNPEVDRTLSICL